MASPVPPTTVFPEIRARLARSPEVASWPLLLELADSLGETTDRLPFWEYPLVACQAAGVPPGSAMPGAGAIFCLVASIRLVDDILDDEPQAPFRRLGVGPTANAALAFQALAGRLVARAGLSASVEAALQREIATMALATALGQHLSIADPEDEVGYWRTVEAKTPPLVQGALVLGGIHATIASPIVEGLRRLGSSLGLLVQVNDDLADAMEERASPDWRHPRSNLAILYAMEADHPDAGRFRRILDCPGDGFPLEEAQEILLRSGAVSFCAHHLARLYRRGLRCLRDLDIPEPGPLEELLDRQIRPLERLFRLAGVDDPRRTLFGG